MSDQRGGRLDPVNEGLTERELEHFLRLGQQLAGQMAEANYRAVTGRPVWTMADVEAATERAIERMEITSRDIVVAQGADPDGENWRAIWAAMESRYRLTMVALLRGAGLRGEETLQ